MVKDIGSGHEACTKLLDKKLQRGMSPTETKVDEWFFFAHCLIVFYICTNFLEKILTGIRDTSGQDRLPLDLALMYDHDLCLTLLKCKFCS